MLYLTCIFLNLIKFRPALQIWPELRNFWPELRFKKHQFLPIKINLTDFDLHIYTIYLMSKLRHNLFYTDHNKKN